MRELGTLVWTQIALRTRQAWSLVILYTIAFMLTQLVFNNTLGLKVKVDLKWPVVPNYFHS